MNLTYFGAELKAKRHENRTPKSCSISIQANGNIRIGVHTVKKIGLKDNDKLLFAQNEINPRVWYILKDNKGFSTSPVKFGRVLCCRELVREICKSFRYHDKTLKLYVKPMSVLNETIEMWELSPHDPLKQDEIIPRNRTK